MLNLGAFPIDTQTGKISGILYGVNMYPTRLIFEPTISGDGKNYYKAFAQSQHATVEAGAAWPKVSKDGKPYIDVKLNSPGLAGTFYGKLFLSEVVPDQYHLLWDEPKAALKHEAKAEAHTETKTENASSPALRRLATMTP